MSNLYPYVEALVIAACLAIVVFATAVIARSRGIGQALAWAAAGLAWFLLVWELARAGLFEGTRAGARGALLLVVAVPLAAGLAGLGSRGGATLTRLASPAELVVVQVYRLVGVVVLVALAGDALPAWLGLPIGLGDSLVGLTALSVSRQLKAPGPAALAQARAWNLAGAAVALFTIIGTLAAARSTGYFFSLYPLVLLPTFIAPLSLLLHAASLKTLR